MKKFVARFSIFVLAGTIVSASLFPGNASAAFNSSHIMSDSVFNDYNTMTADQIDAFLNSFPSSCISTNNNFSSPNVIGYNPDDGFLYGSKVSAGTVIRKAAKTYELNPRVILATLQKEQSLVSGSAGCHYSTPPTLNPCPNPPYGTSTTCKIACQYAGGCVYIAMGYDCPQYCVPNSAGFSKQVIKATWKLKFVQQRSLGNYNWNIQKPGWDNSDDPLTSYDGYMTEGVLKRNSNSTAIFYDGYRPVNNNTKTVHLGSGATAALYSYTPFTSGNTNFYNIFTSWFGDPNSACYGTNNLSSTPSGHKFLGYRYHANKPSYLTFSKLNNTGSACTEFHLLNSGYKSWAANFVTGMGVRDPSTGTIVTANTFGDRQDEAFFIKYTGSGNTTELHQLSSDLQHFPGIYDVSTNLNGISATSGTFVAGDFMNRGYDQLVYIKYGTNAVEVHMFDPTLKKAVGYYDVATNLNGISATSGTFVAGDFFGRGYDQLVYVKYKTNTVEVHVFDPTLKKAVGYYDVLTNLNGVSATSGGFVGGDFLGRDYDQLVYVKYNGAAGKVETHTFSSDLRKGTGIQDIITNITGFIAGS